MTPRFVLALRTVFVITASLFLLAGLTLPAASQTFKTLYHFSPTNQEPALPLAVGSDGSLFGVTSFGGNGALGTVFQVSPPAVAGGVWTEAVIYNFKGGRDGSNPFGGLAIDKRGNLYGTTESGGDLKAPACASGCGTVFKLTPPSNPGEPWTKIILHSFTNVSGDGAVPFGRLLVDANGIIYGTTSAGGQYGGGIVFRLKKRGSTYVESVLYGFGGFPGDAGGPQYGVTIDAAGNIFGSTAYLGLYTFGAAYELTPPTSGNTWKETILYNFGGTADGPYIPAGEPVLDASGDFFGTASQGGGGLNGGTIYELTPPAAGQTAWQYVALFDYTLYHNGYSPQGLVFNPATGSYLGTTTYGGPPNSCGSAYQLSPPGADGQWQYDVIHSFTGSDGCLGTGVLVPDLAGNYYGMTNDTVFEITP